VKADFSVEIFDWNQIEMAKSLGIANIDVTDIEPFESTERTLNLVSPKHGEKGQVVVRLMFTPEIIAKARKSTSTFTSAGRAMTQIGGLPVAAGKGVIYGVAGVFKKEHHERETTHDAPSAPVSHLVGPLPDNLEARTSALPKSSMDNSQQEPGTLQVTVVNAKDLSSSDSKPYVTIRVGDKEVKTKHTGKTAYPEWYIISWYLTTAIDCCFRNETFEFSAGAFTPKLFAWIHDHKTLGRDKELGEGEIDVGSFLSPCISCLR
jgi:Ca2+-dependent lipid-binding protein